MGTNLLVTNFRILKDNDIQHTTTAPGHPATNGLAERHVGEFNLCTIHRRLLMYQATPTGVGKSPSELLSHILYEIIE